MTNALTQGAHQTPLSRDRITARYRAFGPPTELPELNCWSIEKHGGHLASCNSLTDERRKSALGRPAHPPRTAQARICDRAVERRQIHGQTTWASQLRSL